MHCVRQVVDNLYWIGANDHRTHLFENIHPIPYGVSYNSYILLDEETAVFDGVDWSVTRQYLDNIEYFNTVVKQVVENINIYASDIFKRFCRKSYDYCI